jgi:hypothetical protein
MALRSPRSSPFSALLAAIVATTGAALAQDQPAAGGEAGGLFTGLRGFERFHEPLGQPLYFESPCNDTGVRALYLRHNFANGSLLQGGNVTVYAVQARLALTERLQLIATEDGYSELDSGLLGESEGWNDLAAGLKYVAYADREEQALVSVGARYMAENGSNRVLQGGVDEVSPFVSFGKGFDGMHLVGNATLRVPLDGDEGNTVGHWDLHLDWDVNPTSQAVFAPLVEVHGVHYLSDGDSTLPIGGLDYTNLGSQPAEDFVAWAGVGARLEIIQRFELGMCYEFALTDRDDDIMDTRITVDFFARW